MPHMGFTSIIIWIIWQGWLSVVWVFRQFCIYDHITYQAPSRGCYDGDRRWSMRANPPRGKMFSRKWRWGSSSYWSNSPSRLEFLSPFISNHLLTGGWWTWQVVHVKSRSHGQVRLPLSPHLPPQWRQLRFSTFPSSDPNLALLPLWIIEVVVLVEYFIWVGGIDLTLPFDLACFHVIRSIPSWPTPWG